ncbi:unnamed protein product, partial [Discosporangium mesarthrocarpum]
QEEDVLVGESVFNELSKTAKDREVCVRVRFRFRPMSVNYPVEAGLVTDWDDMEALWRHGVESALGLNPMEHPLLLPDSVVNQREGREKAMEILFENMLTPALYMTLQPVLAIYACGQSSGLIVDIGESGTQV